jgi:hypothetical protein
MEWKIGEIVVGALTVKSEQAPPVKEGYRYVVANVHTCPGCKGTSLDVGFPNEQTQHTLCICGEIIPLKGVHWAATRLFRKPRVERARLEAELKEALEVEDYERAMEIDKLLREKE